MTPTTHLDTSHDDAALARIAELGRLDLDVTTQAWLAELRPHLVGDFAQRVDAVLAGHRDADVDGLLRRSEERALLAGFPSLAEYGVNCDLEDALMNAEADHRDARISIRQLRDRRIAAYTRAENRRAEILCRERGEDLATLL